MALRKLMMDATNKMELGSVFRFRRSAFSHDQIEAIKLELSLRQRSGEKFGFGPGGYVFLFREVGDWIEVPRQFAIKQILKDGGQFTDRTVKGESARISFSGKLREEQKPLVSDFLAKLGKDDALFGGIFSAPCGTGKTIMSLKFLSELGRKTIILVHTGFLMKQWKESILKFTDIKESEIGRVQQDTCEWEGKKVVLAMVESLVARKYDSKMYESFGVVVLDEIHRHASLTWQQAIIQFPARSRIGLSATPRRADGLWDVMRWHVGEVLTKGEGTGSAKVFRIYTGANVPAHTYQMGSSRINLAGLINTLTEMESRNELIVKELVKALGVGRRVLVMSDRLGQLDELNRLFRREWSGRNGISVGYYVGGMSDEKIENSRKCNLLFGTLQYCKEGLDDPSIDTLMLATPKGDVQQVVGRILRVVEGKKTPFVIDFVDENVGPCIGFSRSRNKQYSAMGFDVVDVVDAK